MLEVSEQTSRKGKLKEAFKVAFPYTLPIFAGFWFLGIAYGIYMHTLGFSVWFPFFMSMTIFGGSLEFIAATMLLAPFSPLQTFLVAFMVQARHLFYGIAMLDRFKQMGHKRFYLIFGMCDETFSINYTAKIPDSVDKGWFMLFVTLLNQIYWVSGATLGALLGKVLTFDTEGIEFIMVAMFVVIFMEQWLKERSPLTAIIGLAVASLCLIIFGPSAFLIPTMALLVLILTLFRRPISKVGEYE